LFWAEIGHGFIVESACKILLGVGNQPDEPSSSAARSAEIYTCGVHLLNIDIYAKKTESILASGHIGLKIDFHSNETIFVKRHTKYTYIDWSIFYTEYRYTRTVCERKTENIPS
jgi:hypothetical protein